MISTAGESSEDLLNKNTLKESFSEDFNTKESKEKGMIFSY